MLRAFLLVALIGCQRTPPPAAPARAPAQVAVPAQRFGAYQIQHKPADATLLAEAPVGRAWHDDGWSLWLHDGELWIHRVTCGRCRAVQGWTWIVPLEDVVTPGG